MSRPFGQTHRTRGLAAYRPGVDACQRLLLVWLKYSCGLALVVFQQPAKSLTTLQRAYTYRILSARRKEQHIVLALMMDQRAHMNRYALQHISVHM